MTINTNTYTKGAMIPLSQSPYETFTIFYIMNLSLKTDTFYRFTTISNIDRQAEDFTLSVALSPILQDKKSP